MKLKITHGGTSTEREEKIRTKGYAKNDESFWDPQIHAVTRPTRKLSFSYFLLEYGGPQKRHVIAGIDGELRWALPLPVPVVKDINHGFGPGWFDPDTPAFVLQRESALWLSPLSFGRPVKGKMFAKKFAFDGSRFGISKIYQHHELTPGKRGYLLNITADKNGKRRIESIILEAGRQNEMGSIIAEWDFGEIIAEYMKANGESEQAIGRFVRHGADWLHINSAIYSPSDHTIIASGRENFFIKVGYTDKKIKWLFGDITKHWYVSYPGSLQKLALKVNGAGAYPTGQHSLSLAKIGGEDVLLMFNNGEKSYNQLQSVPAGGILLSSLAQAWKIDETAKKATLHWQYDGRIHSPVCSSVYQSALAPFWGKNRKNTTNAAGSDFLVAYSRVSATGGLYKTVIHGIDSSKNKVLELETANFAKICSPWNTKIVHLSKLHFE